MSAKMFNAQSLLKTSQYLCISKGIQVVTERTNISPSCVNHFQRFFSKNRNNMVNVDFSKRKDTLFLAPKVCDRDHKNFIHLTRLSNNKNMSNNTSDSATRTKVSKVSVKCHLNLHQ